MPTQHEAIIEALTSTGGDVTAAARALGISRTGLQQRLDRNPELRIARDRARLQRALERVKAHNQKEE